MGQKRDAAQDRVTIQEAAQRLGVKEDAVRKRIQRGSMRHEKTEGGRVYVWVDTAQDTAQDEPRTSRDEYRDTAQDERVEDLREQVAYLRRQLDDEREARRRADTILVQLSAANAEQARTIRAIEAPTSQELPEDAETIHEEPERSARQPAAAGTQDGAPPAPGTKEGNEATQQEEPQAWEASEGDSGDRTLADSPEPSQAAAGPGSLEAEGDAQEPEPVEADSGTGESQQVVMEQLTRRRRRLPWWRRFLGQ